MAYWHLLGPRTASSSWKRPEFTRLGRPWATELPISERPGLVLGKSPVHWEWYGELKGFWNHKKGHHPKNLREKQDILTHTKMELQVLFHKKWKLIPLDFKGGLPKRITITPVQSWCVFTTFHRKNISTITPTLIGVIKTHIDHSLAGPTFQTSLKQKSSGRPTQTVTLTSINNLVLPTNHHPDVPKQY